MNIKIQFCTGASGVSPSEPHANEMYVCKCTYMGTDLYVCMCWTEFTLFETVT